MDKYWPSYGRKKIRKKFLPNVAYNALIFPTRTAGKNPQVEHMKNLV
jgi:hypothetical protein